MIFQMLVGVWELVLLFYQCWWCRILCPDNFPSSFLAEPGSPKILPGSIFAARLRQNGLVQFSVGWMLLVALVVTCDAWESCRALYCAQEAFCP